MTSRNNNTSPGSKKLYLYVIALVLISFAISNTSYASHAAGGELIYEWLGGNNYKFIFKFYRDCTGIQENNSQALCIYNPCTNEYKQVFMNKTAMLPGGRPNGEPTYKGCPGYGNTCDSPNSKLPGYREWWYEATVQLSGVCDNWRFGVSISNRNPSQNISQSLFYVEATLNNKDFPGNSSPFFSNKPVPYVCVNQPYIYNNGAIDAEKDSLFFEVITPLSNGLCIQPLTTVTLSSNKTPPLQVPGNPFQTNNTYSINSSTGSISFTPTELGAQGTAIRVKEYRNGKLIGSSIRDIQVQVLACTTSPMQLDIDKNTISNAILDTSGIIQACINNSFNFCFDIKANDKTTILAISDNHPIATPGATISYSNNATDSVRGCFTWTATTNDSGLKILTITSKDSTCRAPGVAVAQTFTIPVKINTSAPPPVVTSPQRLCQHSTVGPLTATGTGLRWYTSATGGTPSFTPPTPNTSVIGSVNYYVSQVPNGCESPRVPIKVIVDPSPDISLMQSDDTVCMFDDLDLWSTDIGLNIYVYSWNLDTGRLVHEDSNGKKIIADWSTPGLKKIILSVNNNGCINKDSTEVFVKYTPKAFFEISDNICVNQYTKLIPTKEDATYQWNVEEQNITDQTYIPEYKLVWLDTGKMHLELSLLNTNGCRSTYTDSTNIRELPVARIQSNNTDLCYGKHFDLDATKGFRYEYYWSPPQYFDVNGQSAVSGTARQTGYVYLTVTNNWDCTSKDSFFVKAAPCCDVFMPDAFTPNNDGKNDFYRILDIEKHTLVQFDIYNRWGQLVFSTNDMNEHWDGRYKSKPQEPATYAYYLKYICNENEVVEKKGTFTLIR